MKLSSILEAVLASSAQPVTEHELARSVRACAATLHERMTINASSEATAENVAVGFVASVADFGLDELAKLCRTDSAEVSAALTTLQQEYEDHGRGIALQNNHKGWQLATRADFADFLTHSEPPLAKKMPVALLECLAMVAYKQPISKAAIEAVRGVSSSGAIQKLLEMKLIEASGTSDLPGNQALFITTKEFLDHFGIPNLEALPKVAELRVSSLTPIPDDDGAIDS